MLKSNISDVYSQKFMKIEISSDDALPLQKTANIHNVVILRKFVFNENQSLLLSNFFLKNVYINNM